MGRPHITLSPDQIREVETLAALLTQDQIADYFGICRNTFRALCAREPEVDEHYKRGKAKAIGHVANGLLQKARAGDTACMIFYLKTQAGWRETDRAAGDTSPTRQVTRQIVPAREKLMALLDAKAERMGLCHAAPDAGAPDAETTGSEEAS